MTRKLCTMAMFFLAFIVLSANDIPSRLTDLPCAQNFDGPDFPADWTQTTTVGPLDRWVPYNSNFVGGDPHELHCDMTPGAGITRLISPQMNTAGSDEIIVQFLHAIGFYDLGLVFKLQYSHDLVTWHDTDWSSSYTGYNQGEHVSVLIANLDAPATYVAWTLEGDQMGMEGATLDNIRIHLRETPEAQISGDGWLSWDAIPHANGYDIYSADDPTGEFGYETTVSGDNVWQTDLNQTKKFYRVKAVY